MLSSIGFHISSLSASLLPGRSWLPGMRVGKCEVRRALAIAEVLRSEYTDCSRTETGRQSPDDVPSED